MDGIFVANKDVLKKVDLIVVRVNKEGSLCISRPCCNCLSMMKAANIRRVYYVDKTGNIVYENVNDMISIHASSVAYHIYMINKNKKVNETMFFNDLLMKTFPASVKKINFDIFLKHDMCSVLPKYSYNIKNVSGKNIIIIMNEMKTNVLVSELID
jgi:hypothetical protein